MSSSDISRANEPILTGADVSVIMNDGWVSHSSLLHCPRIRSLYGTRALQLRSQTCLYVRDTFLGTKNTLHCVHFQLSGREIKRVGADVGAGRMVEL
jgi:hypothetical protein